MTRCGNQPTAGIITFHKSLSYGGCLQAYATQMLLEDASYQVFFIDYENPYEARKKSDAVYHYGTVRESIAAFVKKYFYHQVEYQKRAFDSFRQILPVSPGVFDSVGNMESVSADLLVVGSDQVWNPEITGGLDPAFFLSFGNASKRISFASSLGSHQLSREELAMCGEYLRNFDAVSVREEFARDQLAEVYDRKIHVALDPTLQIESSRWRELSSKPQVSLVESGYVLIFMVSSSPSRYEGLLKHLREEIKAPVVMIRLNSKRPRGVNEVIPATPFELLWLIDNAQLVLTDSFHGIAFSINMETPFLALSNVGNNVRLAELLSSLGLSNRMVVEDSLPGSEFMTVDFSLARNVLGQRRMEENQWLGEALGKENPYALY